MQGFAKKLLSWILAITLVFSLMPMTAFAEEASVLAQGECGYNAEYTLTSDGVLTIGVQNIEEDGMLYDYYAYQEQVWADYSTQVKSIVVEEGITHIGQYSFYEFTNLTEVSLPDTVKSIAKQAFMHCESLEIIEIPAVTTIGEYAFAWSGLTDVVIKEGEQDATIGIYAFAECTALESVTIPENVVAIGTSAFRSSTAISTVNITNIGAWSEITFGDYFANPLYYAHKLNKNAQAVTEITASDFAGVEEIKPFAFYNANTITSVEIPDSVKQIGESAFYDCESIQTISLPADVVIADADTFAECTAVSEVTLTGTGYMTDYEFLTNSYWPWTRSQAGTLNVTVEDGVKSIGDYAFANNSKLTAISLPDSIEHIGQYAFSNNDALAEVVISENVTEIENNAFNSCDVLKTVTMKGNLPTIGQNAFCLGEFNLVYPSDNESWTVAFRKQNALMGGANKIYWVPSGAYEVPDVTVEIDGDGTLTVGWEDIGAAYYILSYAVDGGEPEIISASYYDTSYWWNGYVIGKEYTYYVDAVYKKLEDGEVVTEQTRGSASITPKLSKPSNIDVIVAASHMIYFTWSRVYSADGYDIYRSTNPDENYTCIAQNVTEEMYIDQDVELGTTYYYYIVTHAEGEGDAYKSTSETFEVVCSMDAPAIGATLTGDKEITLTWGGLADAEGYYVYRATSEDGEYVKVAEVTDCIYIDTKNLNFDTIYYYKVCGYAVLDGENVLLGKLSDSVHETVGFGAPEGFEVTACTNSAVSLKWKAVTGAKGYIIYQSKTKDGTYTACATINSGSTTTCTIKNLQNATTYYYKMVACGTNVKEGKATQVLSATTLPIYPNAPTNISAIADDYTSVTIKWDKGSDATGYEIYRSTSQNGTYEKIATITSGSTISYKNTSLTSGATYYYKVRAYNVQNGLMVYSNFSAIKSATLSVPVVEDTKPAEIKVSKVTGIKATSVSYNSAKVSWKKVSGATGYQVYRSTSKNGTYKKVKTITKGSTVSYKNTKLTSGKKYYYKVRAYKKVDGKTVYGSFSSIKSVKPVPVKTTVTLKSAGKGKINVKWKKVSGATGYEVYRSTSKNGTYKKVKTIKSGKTVSFKNTSLKKGKKYYYKVRAYRTVNGKKVYGSFSTIKSYKCK